MRPAKIRTADISGKSDKSDKSDTSGKSSTSDKSDKSGTSDKSEKFGTSDKSDKFGKSGTTNKSANTDKSSSSSHLVEPYPFFSVQPLSESPEKLGAVSAFLFEWKWLGKRAQIIKRNGQTLILSTENEPVNDRFPELVEASERLPDGCVLEGVILAFKEGDVLPLDQLQLRIDCHSPSNKIISDLPVAFMAFDLLELGGGDIRTDSLELRRDHLVKLLTPGACDDAPGGPSCRGALSPYLRVSSQIAADNWEALTEMQALSRALKAGGIMIKKRQSTRGQSTGGDHWWSWDA